MTFVKMKLKQCKMSIVTADMKSAYLYNLNPPSLTYQCVFHLYYVAKNVDYSRRTAS